MDESVLISANTVKFNLVIGQGSFGKVFRGEYYDPITTKRRVCAIKSICAYTQARNGGEVQQQNKFYENEIQVCTKIQEISSQKRRLRFTTNDPSHELNIIEIFEIIQQQNETFIVMEYCEITLETYKFKEPNRRIDVLKAMQFAEQILNGLKDLHNIPLIHRDLKPDNIFIAKSEFRNQDIIKIGDFNISTFNVSTLSTVGTINYMAPELAFNIVNPNQQRKEYEYKIDIWAVGVMIHEMISGVQLFPGNYAKQVATDILKLGSYYEKWEKAVRLDFKKLPNDLKVESRKFYSFYSHWQRINNQQIARLISKLLDQDPKNRISIDEALADCRTIQGSKEIQASIQDGLNNEIEEKMKDVNNLKQQLQNLQSQKQQPQLQNQQMQQQSNEQLNRYQQYNFQTQEQQKQQQLQMQFQQQQQQQPQQFQQQQQQFQQQQQYSQQQQFQQQFPQQGQQFQQQGQQFQQQGQQFQQQQQLLNVNQGFQQQQQLQQQQYQNPIQQNNYVQQGAAQNNNIQNQQQGQKQHQFSFQKHQQERQAIQQNQFDANKQQNQSIQFEMNNNQQQQQQYVSEQQLNCQLHNLRIDGAQGNLPKNNAQNRFNSQTNQTNSDQFNNFINNLPQQPQQLYHQQNQTQGQQNNFQSQQQQFPQMQNYQAQDNQFQSSNSQTQNEVMGIEENIQQLQNNGNGNINMDNVATIPLIKSTQNPISDDVKIFMLQEAVKQCEQDMIQQQLQIQNILNQYNELAVSQSLKMNEGYRYMLDKKLIYGSYSSLYIPNALNKSKVYKTYRLQKDQCQNTQVSIAAKFRQRCKNFFHLKNLQANSTNRGDYSIVQIHDIILDNQNENISLEEKIQKTTEFTVSFDHYDKSLEDFIRQLKKRKLDHNFKQLIKEKIMVCLSIAQSVFDMHNCDIYHGSLNIRNVSFLLEAKQFIVNFYSMSEAKETKGATTNDHFFFEESYMSPSQLEFNQSKFEDDIWSLGAIFHYVLTFSPLFQTNPYVKEMIMRNDSAYYKMWEQCDDYIKDTGDKSRFPANIAKASEILGKIPNKEIAKCIGEMLSKNPSERPQIQDICQRFSRFKQEYSD